MRICVFHKFDSELKSLWLDLESKTEPYIFQRYRWLSHWQETIGKESPRTEPSIVLLEDSKGPQALLPFGLQQRNWVLVLNFLGGIQNDFHCPVYTNKGKEMFQHPGLWEEIFSKLPNFDLLHFNKIPEEIATNSLFNLRKDNIHVSDYSYSTELPSSWEEYQNKLTSKIKADSRRRRKRLAEKGELRFEILEPGKEKLSIVFETFFEQKRTRYQNTGAYDMLASDAARCFYSNVPMELGEGAKAQLTALFLDNLVLATHWGVVDKGRFYLLMPTFSQDWKRYSPGRLLKEHLHKWSIEQGLKVFDFTVGREEYKKEWCELEIKLLEILQSRTLKGKLYVHALMAKRAIKKSLVIVNGVRQFRKWQNRISTKIHN